MSLHRTTKKENEQAVFKRWVMTAFEDDFTAHGEPRKKSVSPNDIDFGTPTKEVPIAKILPDLIADDGFSNHLGEEVTVEDVPIQEVDSILKEGRIIRGDETAPKANLTDLGEDSISEINQDDEFSHQENPVSEPIEALTQKDENDPSDQVSSSSEMRSEESVQVEEVAAPSLESVQIESNPSGDASVQVEEVTTPSSESIQMESDNVIDDSVQVEDVPIDAVISKKPEPKAIVSQATIEDVHELISSLKKEAKDIGYREGVEQGLVEGQQEGIKKGFEEGLKKGIEEGRTQGQKEAFDKSFQEESVKTEQYITSLKQLMKSFQDDLTQAHEKIASDILALSLDLAKAMVKQALQFKPEVIIPIVKDAIEALPSLQKPAKLCLNKEDIPIVQKALGNELEGWQLVEAPIERGGCKIETGSNQVDSKIDTRWKRLMANLGQTTAWIE